MHNHLVFISSLREKIDMTTQCDHCFNAVMFYKVFQNPNVSPPVHVSCSQIRFLWCSHPMQFTPSHLWSPIAMSTSPLALIPHTTHRTPKVDTHLHLKLIHLINTHPRTALSRVPRCPPSAQQFRAAGRTRSVGVAGGLAKICTQAQLHMCSFRQTFVSAAIQYEGGKRSKEWRRQIGRMWWCRGGLVSYKYPQWSCTPYENIHTHSLPDSQHQPAIHCAFPMESTENLDMSVPLVNISHLSIVTNVLMHRINKCRQSSL